MVRLESQIDQAEEMNRRLEKIIELTDEIYESSLKDEKNFLLNVFQSAFELIPEVDYGSVYMYEDGRILFIGSVGHDIELLQDIDISSESFTKAEDILFIEDTVISTSNRLDDVNKEKFIRACKPIKQTLNFDLFIKNERIAGISLDIAAGEDKTFSENSKKVMKSFRNLSNAFFTIKKYSDYQKDIQKEFVLSIIQLLEFHDSYTKNHSLNVAVLSKNIAEELNLSKEDIYNTYWAGLVHDIGKVLIPSKILNKKDKLNETEFEQIKMHPFWGYKTLSQTKHIKDIAKYVLHHHEYWNGTGYPDKLMRDEIPLVSQIITVADSFDAMRSDRAYRKRLPREVAISEIIDKKDIQFSPKVVEAFLKVVEAK